MPGRFCARVLCGETASAALLINARELTAHLVDIDEETAIDGVPLCRHHADAVVVPVGWSLVDSRSPAPEPELVLLDDAPSDEPEALELPKAVEDDEEDAAVGEVPPLLSRAFRAAGLD